MADLVAGDVTITPQATAGAPGKVRMEGNHRKSLVKIEFGDGALTYPSGGVPLPTYEKFGMVRSLSYLTLIDPDDNTGIAWKYDFANKKLRGWRSSSFTPAGTNSAPTFTGTANVGTAGIVDDNDNAATIGHELYVVPVPQATPITLGAEGGTGTGMIQDDDTAATTGVAVYVVLDDEEFLPAYALGHLEFVSPTNAHGTCTIFSGGPTLLLEDDDAAATNGVEVRAIAADGGLEATLTGSGRSVLVPVSDGQYIVIADSTTGSTPAVYFDEDAANTYERLMAVVVDNADETFELIDIQAGRAFRPAPGAGLRLATLVSVGPGASYSKGTVGSAGGGPEYTVTHDQAAAIMPGAAPLYVQAAGAGFNAAVPGGEDVFIPVANGEFIKVAYAASPAGVQVYWDHDSTNNWERMKAVVVDNADETYSTEAATGWRRDTPAGTNSTPTFTGTLVSASSLVEITGAPAAQTLYAEAVGW